MTSPVDFISGPSTVSTPLNLIKGKTASFTAICFNFRFMVIFNSLSFLPAITFAAIFAIGIPIALLTKGTVLEARGFTSSTYTVLSLIAYCILIRPTTFSASAIICVCFFDLFHDTANKYFLAVTDCIYVDFNGVFQKLVNKDRVFRRNLYSKGNVIIHAHFIINDTHC